LQDLHAGHAADGIVAEQVIQHVEADVPPAAPIEMKPRLMLAQRVRRVPRP
jgi:hypothetical protein